MGEIEDAIEHGVRSTEPQFAMDPNVAIASGRSHLKRRRRIRAAAAGAVGMMAIAAVGSTVHYLSSSTSASDTEPAATTSQALANYDPQTLHDHMVELARQTLSSGTTSKAMSFVAGDASMQTLPPEKYAEATYMFVEFGEATSDNVKLYVGHADAASGFESMCDRFSEGTLSCRVDRDSDGTVTISSVLVSQAVPDLGPDKYAIADVSKLSDDDLAGLRIEQNVRVIRSGGYMTSVTEQVFSPKSIKPAEIFTESEVTLAKLAADPELIIREPAN